MGDHVRGLGRTFWGRMVLVLVIILGLGGAPPSLAAATAAALEPTFSVEAVNAPLGKVLEGIGDQTGFRLELGREWAGELVTAHIVDAPLGKGLARLLNAYNHYLVTDLERRTVKVRIFGSCGPMGVARGVRASAPPKLRTPVPAGLTSGTLLIVGGAGEAGENDGGEEPGFDGGLTTAESAGIDPADVEVVPPSADGTLAPTPRELAEEAESAPPVDLSRLELVPPGYD